MTDRQPGHLLLAVNCHGWEDFPTHHHGDNAAQILTGWTAIWHPELIRARQVAPTWCSIDIFPEIDGPALVIIPEYCEDQLAEADRHRVVDFGGQVITSRAERSELFQEIATVLPAMDGSTPESVINEFCALGYAFLQIQLMTRRLRYSSSLDEKLFAQRLLSAADAFPTSAQSARELLTPCYDLLIEERLRYYPTTPVVFDYLLVAPTTLGGPLAQSLEAGHPLNALCSAETLECLRQQEPENFDRLVTRCKTNQLEIVGGEYGELPNNLLATASLIRQIRLGCERYSMMLGWRPNVYGRRRFGLDPALPSLLAASGFGASIHATLDDGVFPQTSDNQIEWSGVDAKSIPALVTAPRDARLAETFIDFSVRLGEGIDMGFSATALLVHWPGLVGTAYQDFIRTTQYGEVLGRLSTFSDYFESASDPPYAQNYQFDDYIPPILEQSNLAGIPISQFADYADRQIQWLSLTGLGAMISMLGPDGGGTVDNLPETIAELGQTIDQAIDDTDSTSRGNAIDEQLQGLGSALTSQLAGYLGSADRGEPELLLINPFSFVRRQLIRHEIPGSVHCTSDTGRSVIVLQDPASSTAVVDVPAMGYVRLRPCVGDGPNVVPSRSTKKSPPLVEGNRLRNEFFEIEIDERSGGIRGIQFYHQRGNLLTQRLAIRKQDQRQSRSGRRPGRYSEMVADRLDVTTQTGVSASIRTAGKLQFDQSVFAEFEQTVQVVRGKRTIEITVEIESSHPIQGHPWRNYIASRLAWADEGARLHGYFHESRQLISTSRIFCPLAVEIEQMHARTTLLPGGFPFHRTVGYRMLDTILMASGQRTVSCRQGIGIDLEYPLQAAIDLMAPEWSVTETSPIRNSSGGELGWMIHVSARNVMVIEWTAIHRVIDEVLRRGLRVLLKETEGRSGRGLLKSCLPIKHAEFTDLLGNVLEAAKFNDDGIEVPFAAFGVIAIELYWK